MKKFSLFIILICCFCVVKAQNISSVFNSIQDKAMLPLDSLQRLDIVDLYNAGRVAQIVNHLGDTTRLISLKENYLSVKTGNLQIEMALLPLVNDSKILCMIKTVCAPVCDSKISFFTTEWKPIDANAFLTPVMKDWFVVEGVNRADEYFVTFNDALDISLMQFSFENDGLSLIQTYNTPQYLSTDIRQKAGKYLKKEPKRYSWNKVRYE